MAYVERPTFTQAVPAEATVRTEKGGRYACWTDRLGNAVKALVLASGRCRRTVPGKWVGYYRDHRGKKCKTQTFGDRSHALQAAIDLERRGKAVREGRAPVGRPTGKALLIDHLPDYLAHLTLRAYAPTHLVEVERVIRSVIARHRLTTPAAVDGPQLDRLLEADRLAGDPRFDDPPPYAPNTRAHWVSVLVAFGNWLLAEDRVEANPFRKLTRGRQEKELRRVRRALPLADLRALIATTAGSPLSKYHLPGRDRAALYLLAASSGLRAAALFALTPDSFTWRGKVPASVYSLARSQKAGQAHGIPLNPDAARLLAPWLKARPAGVPLFRRPAGSRLRTADMLRFDLAAAGIPYKDGAGQQFDFHSLRVQFGVMLALAGVSLVAAQQLMQHSTPVLTANIYSRVGGELAGEVAKLPPLGASLGATGFRPVPPGRKVVDKKTGGKTKKPQRNG